MELDDYWHDIDAYAASEVVEFAMAWYADKLRAPGIERNLTASHDLYMACTRLLESAAMRASGLT